MLDPAVENFFSERKEAWLKKKFKGETTDEEKEIYQQQADEEFSIPVWLPSAAKRARQLSMVSHPGKFSHPSAKTTPIIADAKYNNDGLLRSGNTEAGLDVVGNAAALDVLKFLSCKMVDGKTVLAHLENDTEHVKSQLDVCAESYDEIRSGLLAIKQSEVGEFETSSKVKQVYFPVSEGGYHLLSIMTPSSVLFKLTDRIREMHFSDETKEAREARKKQENHGAGFSEMLGLSAVGFGGTKPQNVSFLNNQHGGFAYLLPSSPPSLAGRKIQPPRQDFFKDSLWAPGFKDDFGKFHKLLSQDRNNIHIRKQRDWFIRAIIYQVADRLWFVRSLDGGWSDSDNYRRLPEYQKIWLDQQYGAKRQENNLWLSVMEKDLARWFVLTYRKLLDHEALPLGDDEMGHIVRVVSECEEALR